MMFANLLSKLYFVCLNTIYLSANTIITEKLLYSQQHKKNVGVHLCRSPVEAFHSLDSKHAK